MLNYIKNLFIGGLCYIEKENPGFIKKYFGHSANK